MNTLLIGFGLGLGTSFLIAIASKQETRLQEAAKQTSVKTRKQMLREYVEAAWPLPADYFDLLQGGPDTLCRLQNRCGLRDWSSYQSPLHNLLVDTEDMEACWRQNWYRNVIVWVFQNIPPSKAQLAANRLGGYWAPMSDIVARALREGLVGLRLTCPSYAWEAYRESVRSEEDPDDWAMLLQSAQPRGAGLC